MKINNIEDLDNVINKSINNNNFDLQYIIEKAKLNVPMKDITKYLKKQIKIRRDNERNYNLEYNQLSKKHAPRNYYTYENALSYVTHKYNIGEYILCKNVVCKSLVICKIDKYTPIGYKVFIGRKMGTLHIVPFSKIICLATTMTKVQKAFDELREEDKK